jgi:hypothetical protein
METPLHAIDRLLGALEVLLDREAIHLATGDLSAVLKNQERSSLLVHRLSSLDTRGAGLSVRARVTALIGRRRRTRECLAEQMNRVRDDLSRARESQRRLFRIAPAYAGRSGVRVARRLSAIG